MPADSRFDAPRSLARALAELARRAGGAHAREAELRAALPAAMGAWLHSRLADVRMERSGCVLVLRDESGAREAEALLPEITRELRRRLASEAPARIRVERAPTAARPAAPATRCAAPVERPLVREALDAVPDERLRRRLARWAGVSIDPEQPRGG